VIKNAQICTVVVGVVTTHVCADDTDHAILFLPEQSATDHALKKSYASTPAPGSTDGRG